MILPDHQLYALFHALYEHRAGRVEIPELELSEELSKTLDREDATRFNQPPAPEDQLEPKRVKALIEKAADDQDLHLQLLEEASTAKRRKSEAELKQEEDAEEQRKKELARMFWVHLGYGVPCFFAARYVKGLKDAKLHKARQGGPKIQGVNQTKFAIDPLWILIGMFILFAAIGIAEAWRIANELWIDWSRAKEAVPVVGKAWAEKGRKQKDAEKKARQQDKPS